VGAALVVLAAIVLVFLPTFRHEFLDWDDTENFVNNAHYRGLGPEQIRWMFTTFHMGHFQPLTWVTLGFDYTWAAALLGNGMDARAYHVTNTLLHALNAFLLVFVARRLLALAPLTRAARPLPLVLAAALAGLLFGVHPLRVESVAWVTERRDLLSAFFFLTALLAYLRCTEPGRRFDRRWLALAFGAFTLGLLSKVSVVVLPVVLLVLDWYPLGRLRPRTRRGAVVEKIPFLALSLVFGLVAAIGQARNDWLYPLSEHSLPARIAQSCYGLVFYATKSIAPCGLLPIYEMRFPVSPFEPRFIAAAAVVLVAAFLLVRYRRRVPSLVAAALAYAIVLAPVIGIAQNGSQIVADRYSYLSCLGFAVVAAGGVLVLALRRPALARPLAAAFVLVVLTLGALTWRQCLVWRSTESLWTYTAARAPESSIAQNGYGFVLLTQGRTAEAIPRFRQAIAIQPSNEKAHANLWRALRQSGDEEALIAAYRESIRLRPALSDAHFNLGNALMRRNEADQAARSYAEAVRLRPDVATYHGALAKAYHEMGDLAAAERENRRALELDPRLAIARVNLAIALRAAGRLPEAIAELERTLAIAPGHADARRLLAQFQAEATRAAPAAAPR
jgi:tetratricopeptide (TPR) repeat protein